MSEPWWRTLLNEQQGSQFADIGGSEAAAVIPISDRLVTAIVTRRLPPSMPVRTVQVTAEANDRFSVRVKLSAPALMPPLVVRFAIVRQPELPASPILELAIVGGLGAMMAPLVRLFAAMPPWIHLDRDRIHLDVRALAVQQGGAAVFPYVRLLQVTTAPGRFVLRMQASLPNRE
jgi:hypothetical protein